MKREYTFFAGMRKARETHDQGHRLPFLRPSIGSWYEVTKDDSPARWQGARSEVALCLQTDCQRCHGYNWKTSIAINGNTALTWLFKKKSVEIQPWRREGEESREVEWFFSPSPFLCSIPPSDFTLCPFPFSLLLCLLITANFSLYNGRKTIDLYKSICLGLRGRIRTGLPARSAFLPAVRHGPIEFQIVQVWTNS